MSGPSTRAKTAASASSPTATAGARSRTAKDRRPSIEAWTTPVASRTKSARSNVGAAATSTVPARPVPPLATRRRREAAAGARTRTRSKASAARPMSSTDSGRTRRLDRDRTSGRGDEGGREVRPDAGRDGRQAGNHSERERQHAQRGLDDLAYIGRDHARPAQTDRHHDAESLCAAAALHHRERDPQGEESGRDAEHEPRRRARRHDAPSL